jgi:hypothetical protein
MSSTSEERRRGSGEVGVAVPLSLFSEDWPVEDLSGPVVVDAFSFEAEAAAVVRLM